MNDFLFVLIQKLKKRINAIKTNKSARFVIGTSQAGWTSTDCDYLCDGVNDQIEINAAITALPTTGGEIVILDGTYNISASINVNKNNTSIKGTGNSTILKRMFDNAALTGVISISTPYCKVENLKIDGNKTSYTNQNNCAILLSNNFCTVINNKFEQNYKSVYLSTVHNNIISNNIFFNNTQGVYLYNGYDNTVSTNVFDTVSEGVRTNYEKNGNIVGNSFKGCEYGVYLFPGSNNNISGNLCSDGGCGIYLWGSSNNAVVGNTCIRGTGLTSDYTVSHYTIYLSGTNNNYNLVSSNGCMGKDVVTGGGTSNTIVNNKYN